MLSPRDFLAIPETERDLAWLGHCIHRAPAYRLDEAVLKAVEKLRTDLSPEKRQRMVKIIGEHPELYHPPFPVMWIEWANLEAPNVSEGFLVEQLPNGVQGVRGTYFSNSPQNGLVPSKPSHICSYEMYSTPDGHQKLSVYRQFKPLRDDGLIDQVAWNEIIRTFAVHGQILVSALMILKSRTPILKLVEPENGGKQRDAVAKLAAGKSSYRTPGILTFDLSRVLGKGRSSNEAEAKQFMAEQIVAGHYKLREIRKRDSTGEKIDGTTFEFIWWNPHWRGGTPEEKEQRKNQPPMKGRLAETRILTPSRPVIIPGYDLDTTNDPKR